jgi:hypothetical protein
MVAAGVMLWTARGGGSGVDGPLRLGPAAQPTSRAGGRHWRRLQPISDVAYPRDNIWMEQVDGRDGRVIWGVIQPEENVVVAAAEVGCG